jgi:hypothetical protein
MKGGATMRSFAAIMCFFMTSFAQQPKDWHDALPSFYGPLTAGWQLALFSEKQSFFSDERALVMLVAKNSSSRRLKIGLQKSQWRIAEFVVKRLGDPNPLTLRPPADEFERLRREAGGTMLVQAEPGGLARPGMVNLRALFDLSPGSYTVTASCKLTDKDTDKSIAVPSNQITISVVQRP